MTAARKSVSRLIQPHKQSGNAFARVTKLPDSYCRLVGGGGLSSMERARLLAGDFVAFLGQLPIPLPVPCRALFFGDFIPCFDCVSWWSTACFYFLFPIKLGHNRKNSLTAAEKVSDLTGIGRG